MTLATDGKKVPTIARKLAAIRFFHRGAGGEPDRQRGRGCHPRRTVGTAPHQKAPAIHALMVRIEPATLQAKRDRALLLLGFAGAFRRSELVSITVEDLTFSDEGVDVFLRSQRPTRRPRANRWPC
ncbi:hypothetical protein [Neorhizobium tomejilense]|uniref:hypothetical protein n=1 Tax=Neorhizobium tomejilense TaxID=2093828 RepID=UPI000CF9C51B|nr:hypothetical protein [Neorhizobium tomejilense]